MKLLRTAAIAVFAFSGATVSAQDSLVGKYSGTFMGRGPSGEVALGIDLAITSIADGKVKATAKRYARGAAAGCQAGHPLEGIFKDNRLELTGTGACETTMLLTREGNKLTGTMGPMAVTLSKSR